MMQKCPLPEKTNNLSVTGIFVKYTTDLVTQVTSEHDIPTMCEPNSNFALDTIPELSRQFQNWCWFEQFPLWLFELLKSRIEQIPALHRTVLESLFLLQILEPSVLVWGVCCEVVCVMWKIGWGSAVDTSDNNTLYIFVADFRTKCAGMGSVLWSCWCHVHLHQTLQL